MEIKPFERVAPEDVGISSQAIGRLLDRLESADYCEPHGLMVMRYGKVCAEGWWAPYGPQIPHSCFSLTKTFTATAVGIAYTQGLLKLDDKVLDFFPEYRSVDTGDFIKEMCVHDALCMASGKPETRSNSREWRKHFFEIPIEDKPGTVFEYSCEDTHICMAIVQKVTGQSLHDYLKTNLYDKIGIQADNLKWAYLPDGSEVGCGGLFVTTEDSLRLMKLYMQGGVWEGERILAADYIEKATTTRILTDTYKGKKHLTPGYGYQIWTDDSLGIYLGAGALGQFAIAVPRLELLISFNQTAESTALRKVLDDLTDILIPAAQAAPLPENPEISGRLKQRLQTLSLEIPKASPIAERLTEISGKRYNVSGDPFTLRNALWDHLTIHGPYSHAEGIEWFSFEYATREVCLFHFNEQGSIVTLQIGLDGASRLNRFPLPKTTIDKVEIAGWWIDNNRFILSARWIETCFSIKVSFHFINDRAEVSAEAISGDYGVHPLRNGKVGAILANH